MRVIRGVLSYLIVAAGLGLAATMLVPPVLGLQRYVVTGGSMDGTYDRGSIVFDDEVAVSDLQVGDVITYRPPAEAGIDGVVTHRIVSIRDHGTEGPFFRTKGDANESVDPWRFTLDQPTQAKVAFHVPYVGYGLAALSVREVRMLVIGLPALLIAIVLGSRLWREAGIEARARREAENMAAAPPEDGLPQ
jgi:signal peptidase I